MGADRKAIVDWIRQQQQKENHLLGLENPSDLDDKVEDTYNRFKGDSCFPKKAKVRVTGHKTIKTGVLLNDQNYRKSDKWLVKLSNGETVVLAGKYLKRDYSLEDFLRVVNLSKFYKGCRVLVLPGAEEEETEERRKGTALRHSEKKGIILWSVELDEKENGRNIRLEVSEKELQLLEGHQI